MKSWNQTMISKTRMFVNMTYLFFPLLLEHFLKKYFKEMACLKYSELSKEFNKHFEQKKIIQPQEKEKTIQNLGKDFRNAFENTDDSKTNVSAKDISLATKIFQ